jgi:hypothetical protein
MAGGPGHPSAVLNYGVRADTAWEELQNERNTSCISQRAAFWYTFTNSFAVRVHEKSAPIALSR